MAAALAASRVGVVMVVTDDAAFAASAAAAGCATLPDGVTEDLNGSLVQAAAECARRWPSYSLAALCADLPALSASDLDDALAQVPATGAVFVADAAGTGTTMYAAAGLDDFAPRFGAGSRTAWIDRDDRHASAQVAPVPDEGARQRALAGPRRPRDSDTVRPARGIGKVGQRTGKVAILRETP